MSLSNISLQEYSISNLNYAIAMKKTRPQIAITEQYSLDDFVHKISAESAASPALTQAAELAWSVQDQPSHLPSCIDVALILSELGVDEKTLLVTLLSDSRLRNDACLQQIENDFGTAIRRMVDSVLWLHEFQLNDQLLSFPEQAERMRRMLLSMVDDVRVVLIKLAYRLQHLRLLAHEDTKERYQLAQETQEIFAPIANRLGIGQLKWELEDLSFRFLEPVTYKQVAGFLEEKREERESYIQHAVSTIQALLKEANINAQVYGRPKHIFSIWKKMQAKQVAFDELFDVRAVRITVQTLAECYTTLGLVHGKWRHLSKEFDDYIANPKGNGYQSLHTAVLGPEDKPLEIQIRTQDMHDFAEFGVAAHWRYKEGSSSDKSLEKGIASLRKLLDPNETREDELVDSFHTELFPDRVFVRTPDGKIMDLAQGSTPLDFAYTVHTDIGHRCRGAKVNGHIVQLTYELKNGEQVEILTSNIAKPSRDWMNPNMAYLKTSRARAKVRSWFKEQDFEQNVADGKVGFERELQRQGLNRVDMERLVQHYKQKSTEHFYAAMGRGDITAGQLASYLYDFSVPKNNKKLPLKAALSAPKKSSNNADEVCVRGVSNLLTNMASCCKPMPGDDIIGFITQGQGISIHRKDCHNILNLADNKRDRLIESEWGGKPSETYPVSLQISAIDRQGLLRDISKVLADEKVDVMGVNTQSNKDQQSAQMTIDAEMSDLQQLAMTMDKLQQLPNVIMVRRLTT